MKEEHLGVFAASCQLLSLAELEHGRTIALCEVPTASSNVRC